MKTTMSKPRKILGALALVLAACSTGTATTAEADPMMAGPAHAIRTAKPSLEVLKKELTPLQFDVTQNSATERPFSNTYWNNHAPGIYVDITTGQPLFSSLNKFESGTGWPSFYQPIEKGVVVEKGDKTHGMIRIEVRSKVGDAHLGHVFDDGPKPTGLRYCINSASLRFVPASELTKQGYGKYAAAFAKR